MAVGVKT